MADKILNDVKSAIQNHPEWTRLDVFNSLKDKYDPQALTQAVATEYNKVDKAKVEQKTAVKTAASKYYTAEEIAANYAAGVDPTAAGTATGAKIVPVVGGADTPYSSDAWLLDFGQNGRIQYALDSKTNQPYISMMKEDGTKPQVFIVGDPTNPGQYKVLDPTTALTETIKEYKSRPGGIAALRRQIASSRKIPSLTGAKLSSFLAQGDTVDKTLSSYLATTLQSLSIDNFTNAGNKQFNTLNGFLTGTAAGAGGVTTKTSVTTDIQRSKKEANAAELTAFVQEYLGRGATAKEVSDYQAAIESVENNRPTKTTTTVTGDTVSIAMGMAKQTKRVSEGGGLSADERKAMQVAVVSKALQAAGIDPTTISKSGGKVAQIMDVLKQSAADYGLQYDDKMALDATIKSIQPGADYKSEIEKQKQVAKVKYKNLSSAIDAGTTVKDVADQFQKYKNNILELTGPTNVFDNDIQKALNNDGKSGVMSVTDFTTLMRNKPEWAKTVNAREEAANYATTILRQFGFLG